MWSLLEISDWNAIWKNYLEKQLRIPPKYSFLAKTSCYFVHIFLNVQSDADNLVTLKSFTVFAKKLNSKEKMLIHE